MSVEFKYADYPSVKYQGINYTVKEVYIAGKLVAIIATSTMPPEDIEDCRKRYPFKGIVELREISIINERGESIYPIILTDLDKTKILTIIPNELWKCKKRHPTIGYGLLGYEVKHVEFT
jgi:hypothetical protein